MTLLDEIDRESRATLERYGFDEEAFLALRARVADGSLSPESNAVGGEVEPPLPGDIERLPERGEDERVRKAGLAALRRGEVASVVLTGGMATRFGGVVKGTVAVLDGRSFLELKLAQTAEVAAELDTEIPTALMTSFATDGTVRDFLAERDLPEPLIFSQYVSLRLDPDGSLFRGDDGRVSLYSPGHGDFLDAFARSGTLERLRERGVRTVMVSNVDNLGARIDPSVLGMHLLGGRPVTTEVARKAGDLGGAPARVDGRLLLLEGPRFPPGFDTRRIAVFNVNTLTIQLDALERAYDLTWLYVEKTVDGRVAVQLEHLFHELTAFMPTTYLEVPRSGPRGRFFPIKTPDDLEAAREPLRELLATSPLE
ncbi:MAG: UTP--glucose-1-phosphate uridylyltransferase [Gaiellaceae bacterium MAG52_C11]|nr:UTP--glucose-1-phosphate uridylyltransferase [Candidatus Gaiellasilicea maunaloa]